MAHADSVMIEWLLVAFSLVVIVPVMWLAYQRYALKTVKVTLSEEQLPFWYKLSLHKFYVDELYDYGIVKPLSALAGLFSVAVEKKMIDGTVNGLGSITLFLSSQLRKIQTGNTGFYVFAMVAGMVLMLLLHWLNSTSSDDSHNPSFAACNFCNHPIACTCCQ